MSHDADYSVLLGLFIRLVQSQSGRTIAPGEAWLNDAQTLAVKLFQHLFTVQRLATPVVLDGDAIPPIRIVDHASAKVLSRAAFETYLVFFYLYGGPDRALAEFRHKTWCLGGLADRQKFHALTEHSREIKANEQRQIEQLRSEIQASAYIHAYGDKQRKKLLEGDWRIGKSWADLGKSAGFHQKYFAQVYGYLCGYSHSSYLSALQVGQARSIDDQRMLIQGSLGVGVVLMAHFAFSYSRVFSGANAVLSTDPVAKGVAEKWQFGPEEMEAIYNR